MNPSAKRWIMRLALLTLVGGLILALSEIAARMRYTDQNDILRNNRVLTHDPIVGMKGIAGFAGRVPPNNVHVSINRHGFRDEDWDAKLERARATQATRILALGDSMLFGYRIEARHRLTEQLAWLYARHDRPAEVFNTGIPAYGTAQALRVMETVFPEIQPDVVFLRYCANDFGDDAFPFDIRYEHRVYRPFYDLAGRLVLNERVPRRPSLHMESLGLGFLRSKYILDRIAYAIEDVRFARHVALPPDRGYWDMTRDLRTLRSFQRLNTDPRLAEIYELNKHRNFTLWKQMQAYCAARGARFIVLATIPDDATMHPRDRDLLAFFAEAGIEVVNQFAETEPLATWAIVRGDGHPNWVDNFIAARLLFETLERGYPRVPFRAASWYYDVPPAVDFEGPASPEILFGDWGRWERGGRLLGRSAGILLRPLPSGEPTRIMIEGRMTENADEEEPGTQSSALRLLHAGSPIAQAPLPAEGPFALSFELNEDHEGLYFLELQLLSERLPQITRVAPPGLCPFVVAGQVHIRLGEPIHRHHLKGGFHHPERAYNQQGFRWTTGEGVIEICLAPAPGDYHLRLEQIVAQRPAGAPEEELRVLFNDQPIALEPVPEQPVDRLLWQGIVPAAQIREGPNQLFLRANPWIPAAYGISEDTRPLGIMLARVSLVPMLTSFRSPP